jgi:hypothetical protein
MVWMVGADGLAVLSDSTDALPAALYPDLLQLIILLTWTCLFTCPKKQANPIFMRLFPSKQIIKDLVTSTSLSFAPGLFDVLQAATSPAVSYFMALPTESHKRWGIYLLVLVKNCLPGIYIGSGTHAKSGISLRWSQYDTGTQLPLRVRKYWIIQHKGLLCWTSSIPSAGVGQFYATCLLFLRQLSCSSSGL